MQFLDFIFNPIIEFLNPIMAPYRNPPNSALFVFSVAIIIVAISTITNKFLLDIPKMRRYRTELSEYNKLRIKAMRENNEKLMAKVKRLKPAMDKKQAELMSMQFKPMLVYFIPFLAIFEILRRFYSAGPVAYIPVDLATYIPLVGSWLGQMYPNGLFGLSFYAFYFLAAIVVGGMMNKLIGLT